MPLARRLALHPLEDRTVPTVWGLTWPDPQRLTLSFAPDGTAVNGGTSSLNSTLNSQLPANVWRAEILRAFETWASVANININVVSDSGLAFDAAGPLQGSSLVGDVRIAAKPFTTAELATTTPFDTLGTQAGDIVINANRTFSVGGGGDTFDLYTVALQESGHSLGLHDSTDTNSVMYNYYRGARAGLSAGDIAAIQALYGARGADRYDLSASNGTLSTATSVGYVTAAATSSGSGASNSTVVAADLTTAADRDVYRVQVPSNAAGLTVRLQATGVSLLRAKLTVFGDGGTVLGTATATDAAPDLELSVAAAAGSKLYVRVEAAPDATFAVGAYRLATGSASGTAAALAAYAPVNALLSSASTIYADSSGWSLQSLGAVSGRGWSYSTTGQIVTGAARGYRIVADASGSLVLSAWGGQAGLAPDVQVYNAFGLPLKTRSLARTASLHTVQVDGVTAGSTYYVSVAAASGAAAANSSGGFTLVGDITPTGLGLTTFAAGTLSAAHATKAATLTAVRDQVIHLVLTATGPSTTAVRFLLRDANGRTVGSVDVRAGTTGYLDLAVVAGEYTLVAAAGVTAAGATLGEVQFNVVGSVRNDPIGPQPADDDGSGGPDPASGEMTDWDWIVITSWFDLIDPDSGPWIIF